MAWASGRVTTQQVMRNWGWVYLGNLVGAVGTAFLVWLAGVQTMSDGAVGETMVRIARQYMIRLSDEDLKDPVTLGRCAALVGLSPEEFHSWFQPIDSNMVGTQTKGCAT